ncbi:hypothetical protein SAVIM338S_03930 [Streptomyces avidinii]
MVERPVREADGKNIAVEVLDRTVAVRPVGEIDIETAPVLQSALARALDLALASPAKTVVIDCSRLTFCDSSALNALLSARRAAEEAGTTIRLASPNSQLQRLLEMTGVLSLFPAEDPSAERGTGV